MWLPALTAAVCTAAVDVGITCGVFPEPDGVVSEVFSAEPLLVGLRPDNRTLISSLTSSHTATVIKPVEPLQLVPFTLLWMPDRPGVRPSLASSTPRSPPTCHPAG